MRETFSRGSLYRVYCQVGIGGNLQLPDGKGQIQVKGDSIIDYDERVLEVKNGEVTRSLRFYRKVDFQRQVGDAKQQSSIRPEVRTLVLMRHNQFEVPFSPRGPLLWTEIDLIRTDVFTPALAGILPPNAVSMGDRWAADPTALRELTDLEKLERGTLICTLRGFKFAENHRLARIAFNGLAAGVGEDGRSQHDISGEMLFDLDGQFIRQVEVNGKQSMLDASGKTLGTIEGSFLLTRQRPTPTRDLADENIRGLELQPTPANTLLLFDEPAMGVRFLYPRRWRVSELKGQQITLEDKEGNGLLITLETLARTPTGAQFQRETVDWLNKRKAKVERAETPGVIQNSPSRVEHFAIETTIDGDHVWLDYHVVRHNSAGATLAGRLLPADRVLHQQDIAEIARSLRITGPVTP